MGEPRAGTRVRALLFLFFLSGCAGLVYEVLWLKELSLLFGSTAQAASTSLAAFFAGLALGSYFWGRRAPVRLTLYAWLEVGIGLSAILFFFVRDLYGLVYAPLVGVLGSQAGLVVGLKFVLAFALFLPPAFFMGGTFPVLAGVLLADRNELGRTGSLLYAVNTAGAALGALAAGFVLPAWLGYQVSCGLAVALNLAIAAASFGLARRWPEAPAPQPDATPPARTERRKKRRTERRRRADEPVFSARSLQLLAFLSGLSVLALEVAMTRLLSQITRNDVYSFAAILVAFLVALSLGGLLARRLCESERPDVRSLAGLLAAGGIGIGLAPLLLYVLSDGLHSLPSGRGFSAYLASLFWVAGVVVVPPVVVIGAVFPYTLQLYRGHADSVGGAIGRLVAINTLGGIVGSLLAGFVLLPALGLFPVFGLLAAGYLVAASGVAGSRGQGVLAAGAGVLALVALAAVVPLRRSPPHLLRAEYGEELVELRYGAHGSVAVIRAHVGLVTGPGVGPARGAEGSARAEDLLIRVNGHYTLGGLGSLVDERRQAQLPLLLHPRPRSVFFLGLATGITAGAALQHPDVERLVVAELVPEVIEAARGHFGPWTHGLFDDARVRVIAEDGRNLLRASPERYDVIVADLFRPWAAGVGSLYTVEHFRTVRDRLEPGGLFAQWLPLYQLTPEQFGIVVRTLLEVFPQLTLWRGNVSADKPIVALVARTEPVPLDPDRLVADVLALSGDGRDPELLIDLLVENRGRRRAASRDETQQALLTDLLPHLSQRLPFSYYAANLGENAALFADSPVHSDDRPLIEYRTPRVSSPDSGGSPWLTGDTLTSMYRTLEQHVPWAQDPYLRALDAHQLAGVAAGLSLYRQMAALLRSQPAEAARWFEDYKKRVGLVRPPRGADPRG
jgi:spermidine synthase